MTPEDRYVFFGNFRLDCRTGELRKGARKVKVKVKLQAQPAKLLVLLAGRAGELVTRGEIQQTLWGEDTFVDFEQGINFSIKQIRDALGDSAENPRYVETVPREGYRFIASTDGTDTHPELESSPYPGLLSFSANDAGFFFGREEEVQTLWSKLERRNLLALIGPSGAGKSSLLHAGILSSAPAGWGVLICRPRESPFEELASALSTALSLDVEEGRTHDPDAVLRLLREWQRAHTHVCLCIDAFEEIFTLNDETTRAGFSELIARSAASGIHTLLSMRDDFFVPCHDYPGLEPIYTDVTPLKPPRGPALRRALVEPATRCGYRFEDEALVAEILAEVTRERGALPLLAFAAARLWEKRDRSRCLLTREAYLEIGGVGGALARHAEETREAIGVEHEPIVRELFRNLTTSKGTRAAQNKDELFSVFEEREGAAKVLDGLIDARLVTSTDGLVELTHESLLSAWPRLVRWQAQDAEGALFRDQLRQAARAWLERGRPDDLLWTGTSYRELTLWRERYAGSLTATELAFTDASTRLAERRRRRIAIAVGFAVLVGVVAVVTSLWRQARAEALRAEAAKLLSLAELRLTDDPTEALAYATSSLELADTSAARIFAMKALWEAPPAFELNASSQAAAFPAFSPDGRFLATAGMNTEVLVWPEDGSGPVKLPGDDTSKGRIQHAGWVSSELLVTGSIGMGGSRASLWSLPEGRRVRTLDFGRRTYWQLVGDRLFAETLERGSADKPESGVLRSWTLPNGEPKLLGHVDWTKLGALSSVFAPDGTSWIYQKDRVLYSRPLPVGTAPDRLLTRLGSELTGYWTTDNRLVVAEKSGVTHAWLSAQDGHVHEKVIRKPDGASHAIPEPSGRWLAGDPNVDQRIQLWDLARWPSARPLSLRRSRSWMAPRRHFTPAVSGS